jgi:ABC-2 type transport system ATP-binding protein
MSVQIAHINKSFGKQQVLKDVSLSIPEGQVLGLLGPNGAGKSTLMKILIGLWRADSGTVSVPPRIGYLPENNPLYEEMYVTEYLQFMASLTANKVSGLTGEAGLTAKRSYSVAVNDLIDRVGLTPERHKHIRELSKGYRQRVGLAQALLGDPQLLILDEPTTGLDPNQLAEIRSLIRDLGKDRTVILSTHIMQEVSAMCDRVVILDHGVMRADRLVNEVKDLEALFRSSTLNS